MEISAYQPFYLESPASLRAEMARVGVALPVTEDVSGLAHPVAVGRWMAPNHFCAQPIAGNDALPDGAPGPLTERRYQRLAAGGFGVIWFESTITGAAGSPKMLRLHEGTLSAFRSLVQRVRASAIGQPLLILQLTSAPFNESLADDEITRRQDELAHAAGFASQAGFDGVDVPCCHGSLGATLLRGYERSGRYGGSLENRSRYLRETIESIRAHCSDLLLATRLCAYEAIRGGFGVSKADYRQRDSAEPISLVQQLHSTGLTLLNVTSASPNLRGAPWRPPLARAL